jgi:trk system potassium uptake protein TrkH
MQRGPGANSLDNLFTATSAVSTTGLVTVSVNDCYNFLGQLVILTLIQLGGIGYMTFGSFIILSRKVELTEARTKIGRTVFSLPESFRIDKFIKSVIVFTVIIELAGAMFLYFIFREGGDLSPLWSAIFHSVSTFCTAGFSLNNNSFEAYNDNFWLNSVIAVLSYLGAIGFIVCVDFWRMFTGKVKHITLTSKIILYVTFWLSIAGTLLLFLNEPSIQGKATDEKLLCSFFQSMTALTTVGFNTIPISAMSKASLFLIIFLMVIGASPSGTGGGLKSTTFSALWGVMRSIIRGEKEVKFWRKTIPVERILNAVASVGFYLLMLVLGCYILEITEKAGFEDIFFEAASALGTVGLSAGITASLTAVGKLIIIFLMFCGRLGPLTFGIALFFKNPNDETPGDSDLAV